MPKHEEETYQEYRDRAIDSISASFCGAKWYNATIWLGSGTNASCHHPPAHKLDPEQVKENYKAIHNTDYKKLVRHQMLNNEYPTECEYCWRIEGMGKDKVSDRVYKSIIYTDEELNECRDKYGAYDDVDLKTLEIAFDSNCNFACSYCNASFSTQWMNDIRGKGAYQNLVSDGAGAFHQDGKWAQPYGIKNEGNPYVEAFWKWWENELQHSLDELRITGGEATMSPDFWKLLDWWKNHPETNVRFAVNSNLGAKQELIEQMTEATHSFKDFHLYSSNESFGAHAEYIRDGLEWERWTQNIDMILSQGNVKEFHMMMTINALCLFSLPEFMEYMLTVKRKYGKHMGLMSFNILRFPSFQSAVTLPHELREERAQALEWFLDEFGEDPMLHQMEIDGIKRTISYLREIDQGHRGSSSIESRQRDFRTFYLEYDQRRGKDFFETFADHPGLCEWVRSIPETITAPISKLRDGDSTKHWGHKEELERKAKEEGWVLDPQDANPGSNEYDETRNPNR